jgi:anthranilate synthase/aminodeoxychorismate synthase-like glutamine amidotransferase
VKVLLIDNFDSFTYNLYQYLGELAKNVVVARNNDIPMERIRHGEFSHIVISPGPGDPTDPAYFGANKQVIREFHKIYPLLGICLGHQGIGAAFGVSVIKAPVIMHGKTSEFAHSGQGLFAGLPDKITVMRYHSLVLDTTSLPEGLVVDATAPDGSLMAIRHVNYPTYGLQFHPESFRTETGLSLLSNFLKVRGKNDEL